MNLRSSLIILVQQILKAFVIFGLCCLGFSSCDLERSNGDAVKHKGCSLTEWEKYNLKNWEAFFEDGGAEFFGVPLSGRSIGEILQGMESTGALQVTGPVETRDNSRRSFKGNMRLYYVIPKHDITESRMFCVVNFCGVPCGMNMKTKKALNGKVYLTSLLFMTSQQDVPTYQAFVKGISKNYGAPNEKEEEFEADDIYRTYSWGESSYIKIRHVHSEEGGIFVFWF